MSEAETGDFRLPQTVRPKGYSICLELDIENFCFTGNEKIVFDVRKEPLHAIRFNAADLEIVSAEYVQDDRTWKAKSISLDSDNEILTIDFDRPLHLGHAELLIEFRGSINDKLAGFYRAKYVLPDGTEHYMATTQFAAIDARRAFPCFDEPEYKTKFRLSLLIPKGKTAVSNMPVEYEYDIVDDKLLRFAETPPMSTYLLAFIVGDLDCIQGLTKNDTLIRVFTTPGKKEQCKYAPESAIKILEWQEEYFGIKYPLPKLDLAAIPDFAAGAMENWGLVTFREEALLLDPQNSPASMKERIAGYIAHEFAHMWFGDLVTMSWWDNLWLNESFATWLCSKTLDTLFPDWEEWEIFYSDITSAAFAMDSLKSTHPVEMPIVNPRQIGQIFDAISYNKGASLIRMLESYLGEEIFRAGIRLYLNRHAYGNATTEGLWAALSEASGQDIAAMMDTWTKQPGHPVLDAKTRTHERFLYVPQDNNQSWQIPLTSINGTSWTKLNANQTGFYRVQYSPEMLAALYATIESKELSALDRIGLLDDTYALQEAGMIPATQYLELAEHYCNETEYAVWSSLCSGLSGITGRLTEQPYHRELKKFARDLLRRIYQNVWCDGLPGESDMRIMLRALILSNMAYYGHRDVIKKCKSRFAQFLQNPESLTPNLRAVVCSTAARYGNGDTYNSLLCLYREAQSQEEKSRYLHALTAPCNKASLKKTLYFALSREVRSQDTIGVIASVAANPKGQELAWKFVQKNWEKLYQRYGDGKYMLDHLVGIIAGFDTAQKKRDAEAFFTAHPVPAASMALERALEQIDINIACLDRNRNAVREWLSKKRQ